MGEAFPRRASSVAFVLSSVITVLGCGASGPGATVPTEPAARSEAAASTSAAEASDATTDASDVSASTPAGPRPPDFELESLDGRSVRLSDELEGKVVLLDFWATFCDPCLAAMPHLDELYQQHKGQGFVILGISIDGPDSIAQVRTEVAKTGVSFPILLDDESRVLALYNPKTSAPFSVLIGRDGRIITKQEGYPTGAADRLENDVRAALNR